MIRCVVAIAVPKVPYRCPPGPYERACVVANYLKARKPRSKLLLLDANPEVQSKKALFEKAFADGPFPGFPMKDIGAQGNAVVADVDSRSGDEFFHLRMALSAKRAEGEVGGAGHRGSGLF